jgi:tripartite-type tricarboxylate transporter receptor subunit TctC
MPARTVLIAALSLLPLSAAAQGYPEKPVRFVAPYAPGGTTDLLTRAVAQKLSDALGVSAISGAKRSPALPTISESGLPGFEATSWYCIVAPAGLPKTDRRAPAYRARQGAEQSGHPRSADRRGCRRRNHDAGGAHGIRAEIPKWATAVRDSGAKLD